MSLTKICSYLLLVLLVLFCLAYPIAVIGVAFDVQPPFSIGWAGGALLFLEGLLVLVAGMLCYGCWRALLAAALVVVLSYLVEAFGVATGLPFGRYRYTAMLWPRLPGAVPLPVMFAWLLIVGGSYSLLKRRTFAKRGKSIGVALLGALLATLLDLTIEPVAAYVVRYWEWLAPGPANFYGVPLANFVAWFGVAFALLILVPWVLSMGVVWRGDGVDVQGVVWRGDRVDVRGVEVAQGMRREQVMGYDALTKLALRLAVLTPGLIFICSLCMFALVDLTHGYYWATIPALLAGVLLYVYRRPFHCVPRLR